MSHIIINSITNKNLDLLLSAYPNESTFYLQAGNYELTQELHIIREGVRIIGATGDPSDVHIKQLTPDTNTIVMQADNIGLESLSIHNDSTGICLIQKDCNWTTINNCNFYGNVSNSAVYYNGPTLSGTTAIDALINNELNKFNVFDNNIVYSNSPNDAITFNLQKYGCIRDNLIRGNKISIYINDECVISHNHISDSSSQGISVILPCKNIKVTNNNIKRVASAAFNIRMPDNTLEHSNLNENILVERNYVDKCDYIGFELNNASHVTIQNNNVRWIKDFGLYVLKSNDVHIKKNIFVQFKRGVHVDISSQNNVVEENEFYSVFPVISEHVIIFEETADNNIFQNNKMYGLYSSVHIKDNGLNNVESGNAIDEYLTFNDEIIKLT